MADFSRCYNDHDDQVSGSRFHNHRSHGPHMERLNKVPVHQRLYWRPTRGFARGFPNRYLNENGEANMMGHERSFQRKFKPYGKRWDDQMAQDRREGAGRCRPRGGGLLSGNEKRPGGQLISEKSETWYKITIPYGKKHDKKWLLTALQNLCPIPFTPIHYTMEGKKVQFFVDDDNSASALRSISHRITDTEGYKVAVIMNPCHPPTFLKNDLKDEDLEHLKQCMSKRFDISAQFLDLTSIRSDQDLTSQNINVILSRKSCMHAVLKIIKENIPQLTVLNLSNNKLYKLDDLTELVNIAPNLRTLNLSHNELKSERELDKLKGLKLTELWLDHNPLCDHFANESAYISAVRERFPKLLKLDNHSLPTPIGFDVETCSTIPPCKDSYFVSSDVKQYVLRFLHQYYSVYDSGNRQQLLDAYHDEARFSLSLHNVMYNDSKNTSEEYKNHNRNLKRIKDSAMRFHALKHTRLSIVAFLNELPKTQHDLASFTVDVNTCTEMLLVFTVSGVFKDFDVKSKEYIRAFSRVFIAVPAMNNGLCLVNDALFVRNATREEVCRASAPLPLPPSSSPEPSYSPSQQEMICTFSQKSQMNLEWSQKWLQQNEWDFNQAFQRFIELKAQGSISEMDVMS